ncbi:hypothetical protein [Ruegeria atlantica]|uniref:Uncharacterized protein n=1 Tax=Ruegeria atlantica TaxID=81569 RepID=A0A0P1ELG5_9RHOB|nr:hypothetical protein [Ruegeria atlantica]CUH43833.1 hypothetical protein RUM4293_02729 [Ruegeria atlantica]
MNELLQKMKKIAALLFLSALALGFTLLAFVANTDASIRCYPGLAPSDTSLKARHAFFIFTGSSVVMWVAVIWAVRRAYA